ncbi:MAG: hypothetical protein U1E46_02880 [Hyphomicrobiales bacterium]
MKASFEIRSVQLRVVEVLAHSVSALSVAGVRCAIAALAYIPARINRIADGGPRRQTVREAAQIENGARRVLAALLEA